MVDPKIDGAAKPFVCLCVPTFHRPAGLRKLLLHVNRLDYPGRLMVIVVDNDVDQRAGAAVVQDMSSTLCYPLKCVVEPRRGQTFAYNRAFLEACRTQPPCDYVAVLDDDEFPEPGWLTELMKIALQHWADITGGPVFPIFEEPNHWLAKSGLFGPARYPTGRVPMIYGSGNMMIRRDILDQYLDEPFLNELAFVGGSDQDFFWRCRRDGRSFAWADNARVYEATPSARLSIRFMLRRRFRNGTEATLLERKGLGSAIGAPMRWLKGLALLTAGIVSLPICALGGRRSMMTSLIWAARGAGRIAAEFNFYDEQYR